MSRLSDDEKRVFTDRIAELQEIMDGLKLENADYHDANELYGKRIVTLEEENTLLAEHNQALRGTLEEALPECWDTPKAERIIRDALLEEQDEPD